MFHEYKWKKSERLRGAGLALVCPCGPRHATETRVSEPRMMHEKKGQKRVRLFFAH